MPPEFYIFGLTLVGVALFHKQTMWVALSGLSAMILCKFIAGGVDAQPFTHLAHEWRILVNLLGLLLGFVLLADHFERSHLPDHLGHWLPQGWLAGFVLLALIFVLSSFLDNIAAAVIGGATVRLLCKKVHIGFLGAIIAASNAGGAGSVIGDTTTTMLWISGAHPSKVAEAAFGGFTALLAFGLIAARQQHDYCPIAHHTKASDIQIDRIRLAIVLLILAGAIGANVLINMPAVGVWIAIAIGAALRKTHWKALPGALKGAIFLLSLVASASFVPVDKLPSPTWFSTLMLGFVSAIFDNIPLTSLAIHQGGYDWGFLSYAVGFGGSMIWFGSSAGVALSNMFPEIKSTTAYLKYAWHVSVAYVIGFMALVVVQGWHPEPLKTTPEGREASPRPPSEHAATP